MIILSHKNMRHLGRTALSVDVDILLIYFRFQFHETSQCVLGV